MFLLACALKKLLKSFYFMSSFFFNRVESQKRFYKIVLELACRDRSLRRSWFLSWEKHRDHYCCVPSTLKALFKGNLCFLEDIIKIKKVLVETVKAQY